MYTHRLHIACVFDEAIKGGRHLHGKLRPSLPQRRHKSLAVGEHDDRRLV